MCLHGRIAYVHPDDIRGVLAKMIDRNIEDFKVLDDRGGTGTWNIVVEADKVSAAVFRSAIGRKTGIEVKGI